jgi:hypothetical protein
MTTASLQLLEPTTQIVQNSFDLSSLVPAFQEVMNQDISSIFPAQSIAPVLIWNPDQMISLVGYYKQQVLAKAPAPAPSGTMTKRVKDMTPDELAALSGSVTNFTDDAGYASKTYTEPGTSMPTDTLYGPLAQQLQALSDFLSAGRNQGSDLKTIPVETETPTS